MDSFEKVLKVQGIIEGGFPLVFFEVSFPAFVCVDNSYAFVFEKEFLLVVGFEECSTA